MSRSRGKGRKEHAGKGHHGKPNNKAFRIQKFDEDRFVDDMQSAISGQISSHKQFCVQFKNKSLCHSIIEKTRFGFGWR